MEVTENKARIDSQHNDGSFTPGDTASENIAVFFDEKQCREWVLRRLHPIEQVCPHCETEILDETRLQRFWSGSRIKCRKCGAFFTALTGTFLAGSHFDFRQIILIAVFLGLGVSSDKIAAALGITQETVRLWKKRFEAIERGRQLYGN
jgi:transposase-like protein